MIGQGTAAFQGAGQNEGLEIWRIEAMDAHKWTEEYGTFYSGDSYLVMNTYRKYDRTNYDLHYWLGSESSQDERGVAAIKTVELDDQLGGVPVQHRECEGHESQLFMSYFKKGIKYLQGGVESAFNHVGPEQYQPRLLHLKGKRSVRCQQVQVASSSLNHGDVFVLDLGLKLFQWNGAEANKYEKVAGLNLVNGIKDDERGGKPEITVIDSHNQDLPHADEFWAVLGDKGQIGAATEDEAKSSEEAVLYRVSDAFGKMQMVQVAAGNKLERDQLDSDDVFIVDNGAQLFVWVGKGANKAERQKGMEYAEQYLKDKGKPEWTCISRVNDGGETPVFTALFKQWTKPAPPPKFGQEYKAAEKQEDYDVNSLYAQAHRDDEKSVDDGSGKVTVWRVENFDKVEIPKKLYGQFHSGDSYVILYEYLINGKKNWIIYFWQGRNSSTDEKGASALFATALDDAMGGDPVQVRVVQNKEPSHLLSIFKGTFIVHEGGVASGFKNREDVDSFDTDGISLFHVKGTNSTNTKAVQVPEKASSLNSGDCFVLLTPGVMYVWEGTGANADEKSFAARTSSILQCSRKSETVAEGSEPAAFWDAIGGKGEYASTPELVENPREPRLFSCSNNTGRFEMDEIFNFAQDDLIQDDIFMLDTYTEVWVWVGSEANKTEKDMSFTAALDYVENNPDGRSKDTPVMQCSAGSEPPLFTSAFLGWDYQQGAAFEDPYAKKMAEMTGGTYEAKSEPKRISRMDVGFMDPATNSFSADELRKGVDNVDPQRKEMYLPDGEFQSLFGCSKAEFDKQALWKKQKAKKKHLLF